MVSLCQKCQPQAKTSMPKLRRYFSIALDPKINERGRHECNSWREDKGKFHVKNAHVCTCIHNLTCTMQSHFSASSRRVLTPFNIDVLELKMKSKYTNPLCFFRKTMRMWTFQAKKFVLELKVLRSQTRCELCLEKNKVIFLTLIEALRPGDNSLERQILF